MSTVKAAEPDVTDHVYALPPGYAMHEYEIRKVLGHGGFGITYYAFDTQLNAPVAIKEYLPGYMAARFSDTTVGAKSSADQAAFRQGVQAFLKEAQTIDLCHHHNIVQVRRYFEMHGTGYIVMTFEEGSPLDKIIDRGPVANDQLRQIVLGVLSGLEAVHAHAILHRDIKPSNIIVRADGSPVLVDFGAARDYQNRTGPMTVIMSPGYAPAEQYRGDAAQGPWTDFYALGACAYHCVTGAMPMSALTRSEIIHRTGRDPLIAAEKAGAGRYDAELLKAIDWMLLPDSADRPKTAAGIKALIELTITPGAMSFGKPTRPRSWGRLGGWLAAGLAAALVIAGGFVVSQHWLGLQDEATRYKAAQNDIDALNGYLRTCKQCEFRGDALQRLDQLYAEALKSAGFDRVKLARFISACEAYCLDALRREAQTRLDLLDAEKATYEAGKTDPARLEAYINDCRSCEFRDDALRSLDQLYAEALKSAGFDRVNLAGFISACEGHCLAALRREAQTRLDLLDAEKATYEAGKGDAARLEAYINNCRACEFKEEAKKQLKELRDKLAAVTPTPAPVEQKKPPELPVSDSDSVYQNALKLDTIEGYEAFLRAFADSSKSDVIRALLDRKREEALWNEAERATGDDDKRRLYDRLVILYPKGVYVDRARQRLTQLAVPPTDNQPVQPDSFQRPDWCAKARGTSANETLICTDAQLAQLDIQMNELFQARLGQLTGKARKDFVDDSRSWLTTREGSCSGAPADRKACLIKLMRSRIAALKDSSPSPAPSNDEQPSWCTNARATNPVEMQICADAQLGQLDNEMNSLYRARLNSLSGQSRRNFVDESRTWVAERDTRCGAEASSAARKKCLLNILRERISSLRGE